MSWGFQPRQVGSEWNPATRDLPRGAWPVCGEGDHGLVRAIEAARTVLFDDPVFGLMAYGGEAVAHDARLSVISRGGIRQRFSAVLGHRALHLALDRDGFAREQPVELDRNLKAFSFVLDNRSIGSHVTLLTLGGLPAGRYGLKIDGQLQPTPVISKGAVVNLSIPANSAPTTQVGLIPIYF
jgi:hypothetical protein